jgi:hypothetical protein
MVSHQSIIAVLGFPDVCTGLSDVFGLAKKKVHTNSADLVTVLRSF